MKLWSWVRNERALVQKVVLRCIFDPDVRKNGITTTWPFTTSWPPLDLVQKFFSVKIQRNGCFLQIELDPQSTFSVCAVYSFPSICADARLTEAPTLCIADLYEDKFTDETESSETFSVQSNYVVPFFLCFQIWQNSQTLYFFLRPRYTVLSIGEKMQTFNLYCHTEFTIQRNK